MPSPLFLLGIVAGLGVLAFAILRAVRAGRPRAGTLCDSCTLNDARYCSRPERPDATSCSDYKGRPRA